MSMEKEYRPEAIEAAWAATWVERDLFRAGADAATKPLMQINRKRLRPSTSEK